MPAIVNIVHRTSSLLPKINVAIDLLSLLYTLQCYSPHHSLGHTLKLIISRSNEAGVGNVSIDDLGIADHLAVTCDFRFQRHPALRKRIVRRHFKLIDMTLISQVLRDAVEAPPPASDAASTVAYYNDSLTAILDKHAPVKEQTVTTRPNTAWYTDDLHRAEQERRRWSAGGASRVWRWIG